MSWLGCTRQCKKNRKQHHIQNQSKFLPWYLINGLECTIQNILISLNTLFELHMKSKKQVEHYQSLLLKKGKAIITETLYLVKKFLKMTISVGRYLKRKTMLVQVKEYINKNCNLQSLCNLQEFYTAFKKELPNVNIGFSKVCTQRPKWCVLAGSKMIHSVCI